MVRRAIIQAIITFLWWSAGYYDPSHKKLNRLYVRCYPVSIILFLVSAFTDLHTAIILWGFALAINYGVIIFSGTTVVKELKRRGTNYQMTASMVERFGLFTIIVLGENILGIVNGIAQVHEKTSTVWYTFMLAIIIVFLLWWVFFDMTGDSEVKPGYSSFLIYNVLSIFLLGAFMALGATIRLLVSGDPAYLSKDVKYIFGISVTVILCCISFISTTLEMEEVEKHVMKKFCLMTFITAFVVLIATCLSPYTNPMNFLLMTAVILALPVYIGTRIWVKYKIFTEEQEKNKIN